jgi:hypothetical protein
VLTQTYEDLEAKERNATTDANDLVTSWSQHVKAFREEEGREEEGRESHEAWWRVKPRQHKLKASDMVHGRMWVDLVSRYNGRMPTTEAL